jgi:hypothetical protein
MRNAKLINTNLIEIKEVKKNSMLFALISKVLEFMVHVSFIEAHVTAFRLNV